METDKMEEETQNMEEVNVERMGVEQPETATGGTASKEEEEQHKHRGTTWKEGEEWQTEDEED